MIKECYNFTHPGEKPFVGPVECKITAFCPVPKSWSVKKRQEALAEILKPVVKPDFDNLAKVICDSLNGVAWEDDKQVVYAVVSKKYGAEPRVEVEIWAEET